MLALAQPHNGTEMRSRGRGHLSFLPEDGEWGTSMGPRRFPAPKPHRAQRCFWQKQNCPASLASASRRLVCCSSFPLCSGPSEGKTHPLCCLFFFFFLNHNSNLGIFRPLPAPPKLSADSAHSTCTSLPGPSSPCENRPPKHVTNCYVSFLGLPCLWHQRLNKSAPFRVNVGQQPGRRGRLRCAVQYGNVAVST